ncbi:S1C family serine protease [Clostridiaceae bacterium OttesenSCG-928-D20]|nr:S1C family serine protease [Clostridiaceae bacterium OttesenSCG-928-D20]
MYNPYEENDKVDGEYSFSYSRDRNSYTDATFIPDTETSRRAVPHYGVYEPQPEKPAIQKPVKSRGMGAGAVIALVLICSIISGAMGLGGAYYILNDEQLNPPADTSSPDTTTILPTAQPQTSVPIKSTADGELTGEQIYEKVVKQTVGITSEITTSNIFGQQVSNSVSGSGFVITEDGYIMTNYHVIESAHKGGHDITVMFENGDSYLATVVGFESDGTDIAVLKIEASGLSPVSVADSDELKVGEKAYVLGNPLGELTFTFTGGTVSAKDRVISTSSTESDSINAFQIDAAINSGNSGGPVFNSRGEAIGIATAKTQSIGVEGLGFAIPINEAMTIAAELIEKGYVGGKAQFGIESNTVSEYAVRYYNMPAGVYVMAVEKGSSAEKAGIQVDDVIIGLGDKVIESQTDLLVAKRAYRAGDEAIVRVNRNGVELELTIVFDEAKP